MFTGIVQDIGRIDQREMRGGDMRFTIAVQHLDLARIVAGDSISVQGVCLTAVELNGHSFAADVSTETLSVTTLGQLVVGAAVNLEPALRAGDALGGHLVSGHIDGIGDVLSVREEDRSLRLTIMAPPALSRYLARKGSVTVDGVSLTVNEVDGASFGVNLIPHTRAVTTLGQLKTGSCVNLEIDQVARYVERLLADTAPRR
jgi:riboflavin synthase